MFSVLFSHVLVCFQQQQISAISCRGRGGRKKDSSVGWQWDSVAPLKPLLLPTSPLEKERSDMAVALSEVLREDDTIREWWLMLNFEIYFFFKKKKKLMFLIHDIYSTFYV